MTPRPVILDCDPGQDDAVAVLLALASPELDVLGITTVAGNVPLALGSLNARKIRELARRSDVPVFAGCARPILRPLVTATEVTGKSGLDGVELPEPAQPLDDRHAVDFIVETLMARTEKAVTLVTVGPLTNVALAMIKEPAAVARIGEIVLMGGAIGLGNTTPAAEFNIYVDPHAAAVVFQSGAKLTMLGLDVTHQAITTPERLQAIRNLGTPVARVVADMLGFYGKHDRRRYAEKGSPLHDPCAVAYVLWPQMFKGRQVHVAIETEGALTRGRTVVDWWPSRTRPSTRKPNCFVADRIDADAFYARLVERLGRL
jgi:purine nucleosidase